MKKRLIFLLILIFITSCAKPQWQEEDICSKLNCEIQKPTNEDISLNISKKPMLGEKVDIVVTYNSRDYQGNVKVVVELPEGYQYISGNKEVNSFVTKNQEIKLDIKAKAIQVGGWTLLAYFEHDDLKQPAVVYSPVLKEGVDESMLVPIPPKLK